jgi:hypothetical protein
MIWMYINLWFSKVRNKCCCFSERIDIQNSHPISYLTTQTACEDPRLYRNVPMGDHMSFIKAYASCIVMWDEP